MSAELVLAVVPICLAAMAGCVQAWDKIKLMCNYHNEVETLRFKFEIQMKHFYQEVRLLLGEMFGRVIADAMIRDQNSKLWIDLESALAAHLGGSIMYEDYIKAMDQVNRCIKTIQKRLDHCFPGEGKFQPSPLQKAKGVICVGFRKEACVAEILQLKEWNGALRRTRKNAKGMRNEEERAPLLHTAKNTRIKATPNDGSSAPLTLPARENDPNRFKVVRAVSQNFQTMLATNFTCNYQTHAYHIAQLFLLRKLPVPYSGNVPWLLEHGRQDQFYCQSSRLPFLVSWEPDTHIPTPVTSPGSAPEQEIPSVKAIKTTPEAGPSRIGAARTDYITSVASNASRRKPSSGSPSTLPEAHNSLCALLNDCSVKARTKGPTTKLYTTHSPSGHLHRFRFEAGIPAISHLASPATHHRVPLKSMLSRPALEVVKLQHRIELALILVETALMHYSTVAWPNILTCLMERISIFVKPNADADLSESFHTLHLTVEIDQVTQPSQVETGGDIDMDLEPATKQDQQPAQRDLRHQFGIRNPTLFSLGAAMLQIGLWSPLEVQGKDAVASIRRKAECFEGMGSLYRRAMLRLLYCDFGEGCDLDNMRLRQAICNTVIADLDSALRCEEYY